MEINHYLSIVRRWAWLLILGVVSGIAIGYVVAKLQTPIYQTSTRVIVSRASMQTASGATSSGGMYDFFLSDQILIQTYVELLKASSIFDHVSQIINYPVSPSQVKAEQVNDTRIISITAEDPDPQRAADIANAVVQALITQNDELEAGRYKDSDESLQTQITQVEEQIAKYQQDLDNLSNVTTEEQLAEVKKQMEPLQAEVTQLEKDIAILSPAWSADRKSKVTELQARLDQIQPLLTLYQQIYTNLTVSGTSGMDAAANANPGAARLEKTLSLYQQIYLNLINTREAIRLARMQNTQSVNQIEPATAPSRPVRPVPMQSALVGGLLGLTFVGGVIFLIEYLDDTLKTPEDVERVLGIPLIGYIADMQINGGDNSNIGIYVAKQPRSPVAEAFRSLRTNLEFASVDKPLRTILITSAEASDGKSTVAANLAAIFAQGGKRVALIDCDLRRPRIHRFIGVHNRVGMSDLFRGSHTLDEVIYKWNDAPNLEISIITSGSLPPNPAELLGSQKMNHILEEIASRVDIIVIDSPPSMVADAQVLAAKVDCVVLVAYPSKTHAGAALITREQLDRAGAHIVGAVFNRIPRRHGYYGSYNYYSPYYSQNNKYVVEENASLEEAQVDFIETEEAPAPTFVNRLFAKIGRRKTPSALDENIVEPFSDEAPIAGAANQNAPSEALRSKVLNPQGWHDAADENAARKTTDEN
ncbi:MAG: polysaccharide biosynthesis tyrosine autokinase [Anaerolineales bacterium]|nr:polysaccharide biosynthesis tyrosine autokinase [Anaerolineales bacterium]